MNAAMNCVHMLGNHATQRHWLALSSQITGNLLANGSHPFVRCTVSV